MPNQSPNSGKPDRWDVSITFFFEGDECMQIGELGVGLDPNHLIRISEQTRNLAYLIQEGNKLPGQLNDIRKKLRELWKGYK